MRFVPVKEPEQLDIQTLHRVRERLVGERTALINQLRAVLFDRGFAIPKGRTKIECWLQHELASTDLTARMRLLIEDMAEEMRALSSRITALDREFDALSQTEPCAKRLRTVPGIGALNATAIAAAVGAIRHGTRKHCVVATKTLTVSTRVRQSAQLGNRAGITARKPAKHRPSTFQAKMRLARQCPEFSQI